jgi:hypothetical protein
MKKPHKVVITWDISENPKTRRSFATKKEADAFIDGVNIASQMDGMNGFTAKYTDMTEKPLLFSDLGKKR